MTKENKWIKMGLNPIHAALLTEMEGFEEVSDSELEKMKFDEHGNLIEEEEE